MKYTLYNIIAPVIVLIISCSTIVAQETIITPIPSNSSIKNDFAPFLVDSTLYFTSNRKNELIKSYLDQNKELLYRIYKVNILPNNGYGKPHIYNKANQTKLNTGSIWINPAQNKSYITQNQISTTKGSKRKNNLLGIFSMTQRQGNWSEPQAFKYNSLNSYSTAHPTFTPDGKTMFFVSNQANGYGESDIYMSELVDGNWSEPVNLGSEINTAGKEIFPFYHPSGKLYFSSNGRSEANDFDIFVSSRINGKWSKAKALNSPINSNYNDFSCYISDSETEGYFASDREGVDNIFHFKIPFPSFPDATEQIEDIFCFTLFENGPYQSDTLPYKYRWLFNDGISKMGVEVDHCFPGEGEYTVNLSVYDTLQNVDLFTVATYDLPLENTQQIKFEIPDSIIVNTQLELSAINSELKGFRPEEYYWVLDNNKKAKGVIINHTFKNTGTYTIICGAPSIDNPQYKLATKKTIVVIE